MTDVDAGTWIGIALTFGIMFGAMLLAYEDGVSMGLLKRYKCRLGKHTFKVGYRKSINRYFCKYCKAPRKYPALKIHDGGKKEIQSKFKF